MATYAYRDITRKDVIYASKAVVEDRDKTFFCPNVQCSAHLHICAVDGSKKAYFRATEKQFPHEPNCPFSSSVKEFDADEFSETEFSFEDATNKLFSITKAQRLSKTPGEHKEGEVKKHPPRTLRQIYLMCKSRPVTEIYGDTEISKMILDDRSIYRYPKGCFGNKIIESCITGKIYDNKNKQIFLTAPVVNKKYSFILQFKDEKLYRTIRDAIYNNRDKYFIIVGKWEKSERFNCFISDIHSRKQVAIIK